MALVGLFAASAVSLVSFAALGQPAFLLFAVVFAAPVVAFEWRLLGSRRACVLGLVVAVGATAASFLAANAAYVLSG